MSKVISLSSGTVIVALPKEMWNYLVKHIVNSDFCLICSTDLSLGGHNKECPLYVEEKK